MIEYKSKPFNDGRDQLVKKEYEIIEFSNHELGYR